MSNADLRGILNRTSDRKPVQGGTPLIPQKPSQQSGNGPSVNLVDPVSRRSPVGLGRNAVEGEAPWTPWNKPQSAGNGRAPNVGNAARFAPPETNLDKAESGENANAKADKEELVMRASQAVGHLNEKKPEEAVVSAQRALDLAQRMFGADSHVTAKCHRLLLVIAAVSGQLEEAEKQLQELLRIDAGLLAQFTKVATADQWRALRDKAVKETGEPFALDSLRDMCVPSAAEIDAKPNAAVVLQGVCSDMTDQGLIYISKGNLAEAGQCFRKAIEIPIAGHAGDNNIFSAAARLMLVRVLEAQEKYDEIDQLLDSAEKAVGDKMGFDKDGDEAAVIAALRGHCETLKLNYPIARQLLQRAIAMFKDKEQAGGTCDWDAYGQAWLDSYVCSISEGDIGRAEGEVQEAIEIFRRCLGADSTDEQLELAVKSLESLRKWQGERLWRSSTGGFTRRGRLIGVTDDGIVAISGAEGSASMVPLSELSLDDQAFVHGYLDSLQSEQQDPFVDVPPSKQNKGG